MKRTLHDRLRRGFLIMAAVILTLLPAAAFAQQADIAGRYVWDVYGLLQQDQADELNEMAAEISERYGCGVYIAVVENYTEYNSSPYEAAKSIYNSMDFGLGSDKNGIFLMLSMGERDYALIAHGEIGNAAFTDYGKEELADRFIAEFADDDFYDGFKVYINTSGEYLKMEAAGEPFDVKTDKGGGFFGTLMHLFAGAALSLMATLGLSKSMKSVKEATNADQYKRRESFELTGQEDRFIRHSVETRAIAADNRGSHGGTTVDSGGFSGHSGKF